MIGWFPAAYARIVTLGAQPGRYAIVGALGAAFNSLMVILGDREGLPYPLAMAASFVVVVPTCYVVHSRFTFREELSWSRLIRFVGSAASSFPLALVLMALLCSGLRLPVPIAAPSTALLLFAWNYGWARWSISYVRVPASVSGSR